MVYDPGNGFARYWVNYWKRLEPAGVRFQERGGLLDTQVRPVSGGGRLFTWVGADGGLATDGRAVFCLYAQKSGQGAGLWIYDRIPAFAAGCETLAGHISDYPAGALRMSRLLWGEERIPARSFAAGWIFLRLLALVYLSAFLSMSVQIEGLVGAQGILPLARVLENLWQIRGAAAVWEMPTLFWLNASDTALHAACIAGAICSVLAFFSIAPVAMFVMNFILYLSITCAGMVFTSFQWDMFLLESGFLAIFLAAGWPGVVFLYRWLLFRFMLLAGVVKVVSGDPAWATLTALNYHFQTQPLPTGLAWYAHQLPSQILEMGAFSVLAIELVVPFLVFLPRNPRLVAGGCFLLLQTSIILTGNYNFFNLLTIFLCIFLVDDRDIARLLGRGRIERLAGRVRVPGPAGRCGAKLLLLAILGSNVLMLWQGSGRPLPFPLSAWLDLTSRIAIVNNYGPFAVMTTRRPEIVIEGSEDGAEWKPYLFKYKPGPLDRPLGWIIPHQPRLDWQMWFAALSPDHPPFWFLRLMEQLKTGSPKVLQLFEAVPFSGRPPEYLRARYFLYEFASPAVRGREGNIWQRRYLGVYIDSAPPVPGAAGHRG